MNCLNCKRQNPEDAQFCIYCAARLGAQTTAVEQTAATGPTTRLDPAVMPAYTMPTSMPAPAPQKHAAHRKHPVPFNRDSIRAVWLIGLGILFLTGRIFPGVLVLFAITAFMKASRRGRNWDGMRGPIFFLGLATIFSIGFSLPLVLMWCGIMIFLNQRR